MLAISQTTQQAMRDYAKPSFAVRLRAPLVKRYGAILGGYPDIVQARIVDNLLGRADVWGLTSQQAILAFCEFMLVIAPDFDDEPEIRSVLDRARSLRDKTVLELPDLVSEGAWARAKARRSHLPLFTPPALIGAGVLDQTVASVSIVLFDRIGEVAPRTLVEQSLSTATNLGLKGHPDAPLVVTVCRSLFGVDFHSQPWMAQLLRERFPPELMIPCLRLRIAGDFGRYV